MTETVKIPCRRSPFSKAFLLFIRAPQFIAAPSVRRFRVARRKIADDRRCGTIARSLFRTSQGVNVGLRGRLTTYLKYVIQDWVQAVGELGCSPLAKLLYTERELTSAHSGELVNRMPPSVDPASESSSLSSGRGSHFDNTTLIPRSDDSKRNRWRNATPDATSIKTG